ncbi:uncharacterized protein [Diadema setosum]|uniref:uncharacterized protein n=1 Tax=Diadema setosum TaxID=31175 RepID=UPI003B3AEEC8
MGSPLSPIIANIFMEHFETQALQSSPTRPSLWLCYVDDTFVIWPHSRSELDLFLRHLNQQHPNIQFTMEIEEDNSIPFLDVLVKKTPSGFPSHQVYRKPTHTDRYLHYRSHHHPSVQQSVPNALIRRAYQLSDQEHLHKEIKHVTHALTTINKYPRRKIRTLPPSKKTNNSTPIDQTLHQTTYHCRTTLHREDISPATDKIPTNKQPGVYKIPCDCGKIYIGETGRNFDTRLKEHKTCQQQCDWEKSAIVKHAQKEDHHIDWNNSQLISSIPQWHSRRIREAIEINRHNTIPQDTGLHINNIWLPVLHNEPISGRKQPNSTPNSTSPSETLPATLPTRVTTSRYNLRPLTRCP